MAFGSCLSNSYKKCTLVQEYNIRKRTFVNGIVFL